MAHLRRCLDLPAALAVALVGGLALSGNLSAQAFRQSITTISPPPAERPDNDRLQRNSRSNVTAPPGRRAATFRQSLRGNSDPNAQNSSSSPNTSGPGTPSAQNLVSATSASSAIVSDQSWRASQSVSLRPASDALGSARQHNASAVTADSNLGDTPHLTSIDVAPRLSRRQQQRHRFEPYTATGIRMGSFVVLPEIEIGLAWSSNVFSSPSSRSDHAYELRPTVRVVSNWRRHAVELRGSSNLSFYDEFRSEDDRSHQIEARGRLDVTRRMNFEALASHSITQETRGGADATNGASDRADQTTNVTALTFNRRFNRLSVQIRGLLTDFDAAEAEAITGGLIDNDDQDYRELLGALRLAWEFKPTLAVFGEVGVGEREHDQVAQSDSLSRSADLRRYRAGVTVGNSRSIWSGELAIGYGQNDLRDKRLSDVDGILLNGNMVWRPTALTSLLFTVQSDLAATRLAGSGGSRDYQSGVELLHAFRPNVISTAGLSYGLRDFDSSSLAEATWLLKSGMEYHLNRNVSVFGRYQHEIFDTNADSGDYRDNTINIGMRLRR